MDDDLIKNIDYCLSFFETVEVATTDYIAQQSGKLSVGDVDLVFKEMTRIGLVVLIGSSGMYKITGFGKEVANYGGYARHLEDQEAKATRAREKEDIELQLAKSNIAANELQKELAIENRRKERRNKILFWVNIGLAIFNAILLAIQTYVLINPSPK